MRMARWLWSTLLLGTPLIASAGAAQGDFDTFSPIAEPETLALLAAAVIALVVARRRRK